MGLLRVIEPGMHTTVQDLGRTGLGAIGVARGGAADPLSLRIGNRLVGNPDGAAALEMTLLGGSFTFEHDAIIVLTGGDVLPSIESGDGPREVPACIPIAIRAGERLTTGPIVRGVRTYLCIAGGIAVPRVLGSASTHLAAGFGGFAGRALRHGDTLEFGAISARSPSPELARSAPRFIERALARRVLRAVEGAHAGTFDAPATREFWSRPFTASSRSDRVGVRLHGRIALAASGGTMPSEGMMCGAVQVPPGGEPIILLVDHPTTGGYPVIASTATVDLPVLGQLRPGDDVRFERITPEAARALLRQHEGELNAEVPRQ